jgi:hypothetical protein
VWLECDFFSEAQATESPIYLFLSLLFHKLFLLASRVTEAVLTFSLSGRLNKIGKNPCLVSNKENLSAEDSKTVDAFLKALATKESVDSFDKPSTPREHSPLFHFIYFVQSSQFATSFFVLQNTTVH